MMIKKEDVLEVLDGVVHPEAGVGLAGGGFVSGISVSEDGAEVVLKFRRPRDPFVASLRRQALTALGDAFPEVEISVAVETPEVVPPAVSSRRLPGVERVIAVASGKGGVGKSTVAANLAVTLASQGYNVGILDADIYGPSQPVLFGMQDYLPASERTSEGADPEIVPAESLGVKIMSIGFFIAPGDALVWRGPMAVNALRQLIRQTAWGSLDYLLVDLPPGTGDVHLSLVQELEVDGAIIVSTPGTLALSDVRRGVEMFRAEGVGVPVLGIVENMAWFTPAELPENRYFIFGEGGTRRFSEETGVEFFGEIPIVMKSGGKRLSAQDMQPGIRPYYEAVASMVVDKLAEKC